VILVVRNWRHRAPASNTPVAVAAGSTSQSVEADQFERARRQADRDTDE
jgi:hypothetical protein